MRQLKLAATLATAALGIATCAGASSITPYPPMMSGDMPAADGNWKSIPVLTVGETVKDYQPPGILDGLGAFKPKGRGFVRILANHELNPAEGYAYSLANGTQLTGARVSFFDIQQTTLKIKKAGLAFDTVYDRKGDIVTDPAQVNETGNGMDGFARFCSARGVMSGRYGFTDDIFLTGEETSKPYHPHGGTEWAIDVAKRAIWAVPAMGRAAWENVTPLETGTSDKVALLVGDDTEGAPLYLYVGEKNAAGDGSFLDRNGLKQGALYCWQADNGDLTPEEFNGFGQSRAGHFNKLMIQDPGKAGMPGYDAEGYLDSDTLQAQADELGCFSFSRPEDLHEDPSDPTRAAFASTGRGKLFPADNWGTLYIVDADFGDLDNITAEIKILHDADDLPVPDEGIRSPDNLVWSRDGFIYVQEDRSTSPSPLFGGVTGIEASMWQVDPASGAYVRIAEMDRSAVAPTGSTDSGAGDLGNWESSGVLDVSALFHTRPDETLLIGTVQAHDIKDGVIADHDLVEGGQLFFLTNNAKRKPAFCNRKRK